MGYGRWEMDDFREYQKKAGRTVRADGTVDTSRYRNVREMYRESRIHEDLNPLNIIRECCEDEEHPHTLPVILALDVTGSMGEAAMEVAGKLNEVMLEILKLEADVEFCVMGIGDLECDRSPIQMSQFESDIRIAKHLDKIWFEGGGGGNSYESYTAAWYMGARHTRLDCWKRGKKGIIITMGDEPLNPHLPKNSLSAVTGDGLQADVMTDSLYKEATELYDIYHINVLHGHGRWFEKRAAEEWEKVLDKQHFCECGVREITQKIVTIVTDHLEVAEDGAENKKPGSAAGSKDAKPDNAAGSRDAKPDSAAGSRDARPDSAAGSRDAKPDSTAGSDGTQTVGTAWIGWPVTEAVRTEEATGNGADTCEKDSVKKSNEKVNNEKKDRGLFRKSIWPWKKNGVGMIGW